MVGASSSNTVKTTMCMKFYKSGSQAWDKCGLDTKPDIYYCVEHSGSTSICEHLVFCLLLNHRQPIWKWPTWISVALKWQRWFNELSKSNAFVEAGAIFSFMEAIACFICAGINMCYKLHLNWSSWWKFSLCDYCGNCKLTFFIHIKTAPFFFSPSNQQCLKCWRILSR